MSVILVLGVARRHQILPTWPAPKSPCRHEWVRGKQDGNATRIYDQGTREDNPGLAAKDIKLATATMITTFRRWRTSVEEDKDNVTLRRVRVTFVAVERHFFCGAATQRGPWPPHSWGFLDHTQRRTTVGRTPLDEWSVRRRDLYLTTHNTHNRQTSTPPVGFEPTISAGERPQTYTLDRAATGTGVERQLVLHIV